jgi:hypothetical protein
MYFNFLHMMMQMFRLWWLAFSINNPQFRIRLMTPQVAVLAHLLLLHLLKELVQIAVKEWRQIARMESMLKAWVQTVWMESGLNAMVQKEKMQMEWRAPMKSALKEWAQMARM